MSDFNTYRAGWRAAVDRELAKADAINPGSRSRIEHRARLRAARKEATLCKLDPARVAVIDGTITVREDTAATVVLNATVPDAIACIAGTHGKDGLHAVAGSFDRRYREQGEDALAVKYADLPWLRGRLHKPTMRAKGSRCVQVPTGAPKPPVCTLATAAIEAEAREADKLESLVRDFHRASGKMRKAHGSKIRAILRKWSHSDRVREAATRAGWRV